MAQLASASGLGPEGPVFESQYPDSRGKPKRFSSFLYSFLPPPFSLLPLLGFLLAFVSGSVLFPSAFAGVLCLPLCWGSLSSAFVLVFCFLPHSQSFASSLRLSPFLSSASASVVCPPLLPWSFASYLILSPFLPSVPVFSINLIIGLRNGNGRGEESPPKLPTAARRSWRAA